MFSRCKGMAGLALYLWLLSFQSQATDQPIGPVMAQPNKCVALTQGRECFAQITLTWQTPHTGDYCLVQESQDAQVPRGQVLKCWNAASNGQFLFDMQSAQNVVIVLREKNHQETIGRSVIQVSWLYQSNSRKRRWRLF